ncbi:MAG: GGDEF domain-containing protein [Oscillospiraceae bacterium]
MELTISLIMAVLTFLVFVLIGNLRVKSIKPFIALVPICAMCVIAYMLKWRLAAVILALLLCIVVLYILSEERDFRFVFALATAALFSYLTVNSVACAVAMRGALIGLCAALLTAGISAYLILSKYRQIKKLLLLPLSVWNNMSVCAVLLFIFACMLCAYPTPLLQRADSVMILPMYTALCAILYNELLNFVSVNIDIESMLHSGELLEAKISLKNSQLEVQKLYYTLAQTDLLTGLANRAAFEKNKLSTKANWNELMPAVCFSFDLNNLKEINDNYGHASGDKALCGIANILREVFSDTPEVYRMGGDEFIVMGYRVTEDDAQNRLNKFKDKISAYNAVESEPIYCAAGMAFAFSPATPFETIVSEADCKMYEDKRKYNNVPRN